MLWAAMVLEGSSLWDAGSVEPVGLLAPNRRQEGQAPQPLLLHVVARLALEAKLARTGAKAEKVLRFARRRRGLGQGLGASTANEAQHSRAKRYRQCCVEAFRVLWAGYPLLCLLGPPGPAGLLGRPHGPWQSEA